MTITWMTYLFIAIGGALGACLRFFANVTVTETFGKSLPYATLGVNVLGSFCLGLAFAWFSDNTNINNDVKLMITVGLLGAFTTFSTFSLEVFLYLQEGDWIRAFATILLNVCLCLVAVWCALSIMKG
ncbi:fluoride efflux transporter CrcB [Glaciecola sp. XM2]|jgi:CrcB protein|uniref:fluoride efflux transporter CrcB n=1 Tax=Glaciecola sp. XM2 TaxID=1914931 RepID=UPI001BDF5F69|nr:fluoride efflux transporter CrcB [Glaciecola sp. XM2]MBT1449614.1 fluoride efflux transporter CrcB [Glaciecola sp. XM2]